MPRLTCIDRLRTTLRPSKDFVRPWTSIAISGAAAGAPALPVGVQSSCGTSLVASSPAARRGALRSGRSRFDQEHELGALLQAVDDRRSEFEVREMKLTLAVCRITAIALTFTVSSSLILGSVASLTKKRTLRLLGGNIARPACRRRPISRAEIDLLELPRRD